MRKRIYKLDFIKIKNFYCAKDTVKRMKRPGIALEKVFAKVIADKGLLSKIKRTLKIQQ